MVWEGLTGAIPPARPVRSLELPGTVRFVGSRLYAALSGFATPGRVEATHAECRTCLGTEVDSRPLAPYAIMTTFCLRDT